jgi:hypothetical protein
VAGLGAERPPKVATLEEACSGAAASADGCIEIASGWVAGEVVGLTVVAFAGAVAAVGVGVTGVVEELAVEFEGVSVFEELDEEDGDAGGEVGGEDLSLQPADDRIIPMPRMPRICRFDVISYALLDPHSSNDVPS